MAPQSSRTRHFRDITRLDIPSDHPMLLRLTLLEDTRADVLRVLEDKKRHLMISDLMMKRNHNQGLPISCLPAELLSKIFSYCWTLEERYDGRGSWSYKDDVSGLRDYIEEKLEKERQLRYRLPFELRISQVCRSWNSVAQGSYRLWQTLTLPRYRPKIGYPYAKTPHFSHIFEREYVRRYLKNSKGAALTIRIHLATFDLWDEIWPVLRPTVHRWKRLSLSFGDYDVERTLFPVLNDLQYLSAPILEDLSIQDVQSDFKMKWDSLVMCFDLDEDEAQSDDTTSSDLPSELSPPQRPHPRTWEQRRQPVRIFTAGTPRLESLRTDRSVVICGSNPPKPRRPNTFGLRAYIMPSLTTLFLHRLAAFYWDELPYDLVTILVSSPSLQNLSIGGDIRSCIRQLPAQPIPLFIIKSLRLLESEWCAMYDNYTQESESFYRFFTTPNLESLTMTRIRSLDRWLTPTESVKTLRLEDFFRDRSAIMFFSRKFPNVERVELAYTRPSPDPDSLHCTYNFSYHTNSMLKEILSSDTVIWPHLHELCIWGDFPECYDLWKLRSYLLMGRKIRGRSDSNEVGLKLRIRDLPRTMPGWLLRDCVGELEVLRDEDRPATWPWWEGVLSS